MNKGVYISLLKKGQIKRQLITVSGELPLEDANIVNEIIEFSELSLEPYAEVVDYLRNLIGNIDFAAPDLSAKDIATLDNFWETVFDLVTTLEEEQPLYGTLTRTLMENMLAGKEGPAKEDAEKALFALSDVIHFQFMLDTLLSDMLDRTPLDLDEKYAFLKNARVVQVLTLGDTLDARYFLRSVPTYYYFLLLHFIAMKPRVLKCQCCGRYFIPKTEKKETLYCDRVIKNGRTCKQIAPHLKHKVDYKDNIVVKTFDLTKDMMHKRYQRTLDGKSSTDKDLTYNDYYKWLDKATQARDDYLADLISAEEALSIIKVS